ncbi:MAG: Ig-like domain-containing protein [Longimicrobiales bacterium]
MIKRTNRALLSALAITAILTGCEQALLHDPAPATTMLGLQFSLNSATSSSLAGAYDKANQVRVAVFRAADFRGVRENFTADFSPIGALLVTSQAFAPAAENRVQIEVDLENEIEPLVVIGALLQGNSPLFAGIATVQARRGEVNSTSVVLVPIPNRVSVSAPPATLTALNETANISAAVLFASGDTINGAALTFSSSNAAVATVDGTGRVTARNDGTAQITVASANEFFTVSQVVNVTVAIAVASITVTPSPVTMDAGTLVLLTATARDRLNNVLTGRTFTWSSSATGVATVDATGRVTGVSAGQAVITVRSGTASANVNVTVQVRPTIGLSATSVPFSIAFGEPDPAAVNINVSNIGSGTLSGLAIANIRATGSTTSTTWLTATLSATTAPATLTVRVARGTLGPGTYTAAFDIQSNASNGTQTITVTFTIIGVQLAGRVRNATNFAVIPGATVVAVATTGQSAPVSTTADASGAYTLAVAANASYRVSASAQGFITQSITLTTTTAPSQPLDFVLSPVLQAGQWRIVLTWGANPADLDAHLFGPMPESSTRFHVFYPPENRGSLTAVPYALLDLDDIDGFGPETVTIAQQIGGRYTYSVHHFSGTGTIATSGALVSVYRGAALVAEFRPPNVPCLSPPNVCVWNVFAIDAAGLSPIQTIGGTYSGSIVLPDYLARFRRDLTEAQQLIVEAGQKYQKSKR